MSPSREKKTPGAVEGAGANSEQLSFLPPSPLSPTMPEIHTAAWLALRDMVTLGPITQVDWLAMHRGWRLAAAIKALRYCGWPIDAEWLNGPQWRNPIKRYCLPPEALQLAATWLRVEVSA